MLPSRVKYPNRHSSDLGGSLIGSIPILALILQLPLAGVPVFLRHKKDHRIC